MRVRDKYKVCQMEGNWHVVEGNKILSYENFSSEEGARKYADLMNFKVQELEDLADRIFTRMSGG